jgi:hypothetical protein
VTAGELATRRGRYCPHLPERFPRFPLAIRAQDGICIPDDVAAVGRPVVGASPARDRGRYRLED